ncbi:MAG: mandelate racemase/muconate lactonizing enzyme family protein [Rhodospirillaceae bacterium]|nr:mandelate racemase/muconate lactonizing enzyme family protein [Rhodospirillaceae bacterium]MBT7267880.1 mandelate racemase/muconate lactonizing enzyme family protein [Rhodospirillaceae bacterium]
MAEQPCIKSIETMSCDAGWRNYYFVKLTSDDGIVGWSEYDESFGPLGVTLNINKFADGLIGLPIAAHELIFAKLFSANRAAFAGVTGQAIGAIENALLDAKAKHLNIPCADLLGGRIRDRIPVYWSHCGSWRMPPRAEFYGNQIKTLEDVKNLGAEARERGFSAIKVNGYRDDGQGGMAMWSPGFGEPFQPELNIDRAFLTRLRDYLEAFRDGAGPDMNILLDVNFNARTEGFLQIIRALEDFDLFWLELDHNNPDALASIRSASPFPIASCETLIGQRQFLPYFEAQSMDVTVIDAIWNGVWQSMKVAAAADAHEINIAPHNFYGHLGTMMNAHFAAAVPNLRIMETDIDRLPWDDEIFSTPPVIENSYLSLPDLPGWGCDPNEDAIRAHPPKT